MLDLPGRRDASEKPTPTTPMPKSLEVVVGTARSHLLEYAPNIEPSSSYAELSRARWRVRSRDIVTADSAKRTGCGTKGRDLSKRLRARTSGSGSVRCSPARDSVQTPFEAACSAERAARTRPDRQPCR